MWGGNPFVPEMRQGAKSGEQGVLRVLLIIVLIILLFGALPTWPYSRSWGYYPSGGLGLIVIVVIVLLLAGRL